MALEVQPLAGACGTLSYLLTDPRTRCCAVINPLADTADSLASAIESNGLICEWVLATDADSALGEFAGRFLCARTGGPGESGYDVCFEDDQRLTIGHANGRVWRGEACASYVFDTVIIAGCPVGAMSTVGRADRLNRLSPSCTVLLQKPLDPARPYAGCKSTLEELRALGAILG